MRKSSVILIIDDNLDDIMITERVISKISAEFKVEAAFDEMQAKRCLEAGMPPDLIILDLKLQESNGIEILQFIRNNGQTRYIPVIVLSTSKLESDVRSAYDAGASSFLLKRHDYHEFTGMLNTAVHYWLDVNVSPD